MITIVGTFAIEIAKCNKTNDKWWVGGWVGNYCSNTDNRPVYIIIVDCCNLTVTFRQHNVGIIIR